MLLHLIAADYARKMPPPVNGSRFFREKAYKYTPQMDIFLRYGAAHSDAFLIWGRLCFGGFVGFPANFFDDLIKHYYETKVPTKAVHNVEIDLNSPVPWPVALIEPQAGEMGVEEVKADNGWKWVHYIMRNKHNPGIAFKLIISFDGEKCYRMPGQKGPKCYQQMIGFAMRLVENAQLGEGN